MVFQSPIGRQYHGKEEKGIYKSLSLGDLIKFTSIFERAGSLYTFTLTIDRNQLSKTDLSDLKQLKKREGKRGFKVEVFNLNLKNVDLQSIYSHFTIN